MNKINPDKLPGSRGGRVFIGGDYNHMPDLRKIAKIVEDINFIPIIAHDCDVDLSRIHDEDLRLVHDCKYAIFEVSSPAGQLMELERTIDYGTISYVFYKQRSETDLTPPPTVSSMVKTLLNKMERWQQGYLIGYLTDDELKNIIQRVLRGLKL